MRIVSGALLVVLAAGGCEKTMGLSPDRGAAGDSRRDGIARQPDRHILIVPTEVR